MDFQKAYPHPRLAGETIVVQWTRGYTSVKVWFRSRLIGELNDPRGLFKGISLEDEMVGKITVQLSRNPYFLNVLVDGYHSPVNTLHPLKTFPYRRFWLIVPTIIYLGILYGNSGFLTNDVYQPAGSRFFFGYALCWTVLTVLAYYGIKYRKLWPFVSWFILVILQGLLLLGLYLFEITKALAEPDVQWSILDREGVVLAAVCIGLYSGFLLLLHFLVLKPGLALRKHLRNVQSSDSTLVDAPVLNS
jgi:hypothetical protein